MKYLTSSQPIAAGKGRARHRKKKTTLVVESYCPVCEKSLPGALDTCPDDGARLVRLTEKEVNLVGTVFDERFELVRSLGVGGMGTVYLAHELGTGHEVALKLIRAELTSDIDISKRFVREARISSELDHPNTVTVFESGQSSAGLLYLTMEYLRGHTLEEKLERSKKLSWRRVARVAAEVLSALECAHAHGVVHRDLKPSNIMLVSDEERFEMVKVLDFGLAKSLGSERQSGGSFLMGTPAYLAPETILRGEVTPSSDLYSLGILMYELLSGKIPFDDEVVAKTLMAHVYEEPAPLPVEVAAPVAAVVMRLLRKEPEQRYASAADARAALLEILEDSSTDTERTQNEFFRDGSNTIPTRSALDSGATPTFSDDTPTGKRTPRHLRHRSLVSLVPLNRQARPQAEASYDAFVDAVTLAGDRTAPKEIDLYDLFDEEDTKRRQRKDQRQIGKQPVIALSPPPVEDLTSQLNLSSLAPPTHRRRPVAVLLLVLLSTTLAVAALLYFQ